MIDVREATIANRAYIPFCVGRPQYVIPNLPTWLVNYQLMPTSPFLLFPCFSTLVVTRNRHNDYSLQRQLDIVASCVSLVSSSSQPMPPSTAQASFLTYIHKVLPINPPTTTEQGSTAKVSRLKEKVSQGVDRLHVTHTDDTPKSQNRNPEWQFWFWRTETKFWATWRI